MTISHANKDSKSPTTAAPSVNKQFFMDKKDYHSYKLSAVDLPMLVTHFNKKHHIKIIINGETDLGKIFIEKNKQALSDKVALYKQNPQKYVNYLKKFWYSDYSEPKLESDPYVIWRKSEERKEIREALSSYLIQDDFNAGDFKNNLSVSDYNEINMILSKLPCAPLIETRIRHYIAELENERRDCCLSRQEALSEARSIQATLKANEAIGYLFTNNHTFEDDHFEALIITKDALISPINFFIDTSRSLQHSNNFSVPFSWSYPQATTTECGTLTLLYLKEILKNNHQQLKESCLIYPYYDTNNAVLKFAFIPSPHVLRYSQAGLFNDIIAKMMESSTKAILTTKANKKINLKTIQKILSDSMIEAKKHNDETTYAANKDLLQRLPLISSAWLKEYKTVQIKRNKMNDKQGLNRYLAYATQKCEARKNGVTTDFKHDEKQTAASAKTKQGCVTM
jgi:hypothetical protein